MTFIDRRQEQRPKTGAAPFRLDEVFYSRTDKRGVIQSGNYVFRRVSDYDWPDLIGAPHKIVRHPDMPRGVFHYFWTRIGQGDPFGAYVKNLARDGLHYWVFAVVLPLGDGYLSARIKPSSPLWRKMETVYADLSAAEKSDKLAPDDSAQHLLGQLADLGFASYDQFAAIALAEELTCRDLALTGAADPHLQAMKATFEAARNMAAETQALIHDFEGMQTIPHNLRVIASRLEPTGGPISTLSQNYGTMSREMSGWFEHNVLGPKSDFSKITGTVATSLFLTGMVRVLAECEAQMRHEQRKLGHQDASEEHAQLIAATKAYQTLAHEGLMQVRRETRRILDACKVMNRYVLGLSSTRIMCKIESARLQEGGIGLADIIQQLKLFQERVTARLEAVEAKAHIIALTRD